MFKSIILKTKNIVKNYFYIIIISVVVFSLFCILGFCLFGGKNLKESFTNIAINYYKTTISVDVNIVGFLFKNAFSLLVTFIILAVLLSNKYTIYLSFIVIAYNGYILGVFLNIFIFNLGITGIVIFIFTIFIKYIFFIIAIILFIIFSLYLINNNCNKINQIIKLGLLVYQIALLGCIIELLLIITLLRPINLSF